uniref:Uncharacterized protein n=1 Tax=Arundo donax TaxID=35708 RepID=A0A0A9A798_ARUDO
MPGICISFLYVNYAYKLLQCCIPCATISYLEVYRSSSAPTFMLGPDAALIILLSRTTTSTMNTPQTGR